MDSDDVISSEESDNPIENEDDDVIESEEEEETIESEDDDDEEDIKEDDEIKSEDEDEDDGMVSDEEDDEEGDMPKKNWFRDRLKEEDESEDELSDDEDDEETPTEKALNSMKSLIEELKPFEEKGWLDWRFAVKVIPKLVKESEELRKLKKPVSGVYIEFLVKYDNFINEKLTEDPESKKYMHDLEKGDGKALTQFRKMLKKETKKHSKEIKKYNKDPEDYMTKESSRFALKDKAKEERPWFMLSDSDDESEEEEDDTWLNEESDGEEEEEGKEEEGESAKAEPKQEIKKVEWTEELILAKLIEIEKGVSGQRDEAEINEMLEATKRDDFRLRLLFLMINIVNNKHDVDWFECCHRVIDCLNIMEKHPKWKITMSSASNSKDQTEKGEVASDIFEMKEEMEVAVNGQFFVSIDTLNRIYMGMLQQSDPYSVKFTEIISFEEILFNIFEKSFQYFSKCRQFNECVFIANMIMFYLHDRKEEDHKKIFDHRIQRILKEKEEKSKEENEEEGEGEEEKAKDINLLGKEEESEWKKKIQLEIIDEKKALIRSSLNETMYGLFKFVMENGKELVNETTKSKCFMIYHHSVNNRYNIARSLNLQYSYDFNHAFSSDFEDKNHEGHVDQDDLFFGGDKVDLECKILFNRTMTQLGMCAFRKGNFKDCNVILCDIHSSSQKRELLGQHIRADRRTVVDEKHRMVPFHMFINLDMLEAMYLISLILNELPLKKYGNHRTHTINDQQRGIFLSKKRRVLSFNRFANFYSRLVFNGPPQTTRDVIFHAMKALSENSDWESSFNSLDKLDFWKHVPEKWVGETKEKLKEEMKITGLKNFLYSAADIFDNLRLDFLQEKFQLKDLKRTIQIVSSVIIKDGLNARIGKNKEILTFNQKNRKPEWYQIYNLHERINHFSEDIFGF